MDRWVLRVCTLPFAFQCFSSCHTYFMVADADVILQQDCDLLCLKGFKVRPRKHTDPAECVHDYIRYILPYFIYFQLNFSHLISSYLFD